MRALVIEGGGMKAAFANGVLSAFEETGYHPWDLVVGTSAGGALGAWYSAGQSHRAEETWNYVRDPRIMSYARGLRGEPILDHAKLIDVVYADELPMDVDAVCHARWPVVVTASNVATGECRYEDVRKGHVLAWIKATGRLPIASGPPVTIEGMPYLDGGILDPVPVQWAIDQGATHVTLIANHPAGATRKDARVLAELASRKYPKLRDGLMNHQKIKHAAYALAEHPPAGVTTSIIRPARMEVHRLSRDLNAIRGAIEDGRTAGHAHAHAKAAI